MRKLPPEMQAEFLLDIVERNVMAIAEHASDIRIDTMFSPSGGMIVIDVFVRPDDVGIVLGERGATIDAIRRIVWTACKKTDLRAHVSVFPLPYGGDVLATTSDVVIVDAG